MPLGSSEPGAARASSSRRRWKGPFLVHASGAPVAGSSVRLRRSPEIHQSLGREIQPKSEAQTKIGSTPRQSETSLAAAGCITTFSNMKPTRQPRSAARSSRTNSAERKKRLPRVPLWPVSAPIREKSWQGGAAIIRTTHSPAGSRRLISAVTFSTVSLPKSPLCWSQGRRWDVSRRHVRSVSHAIAAVGVPKRFSRMATAAPTPSKRESTMYLPGLRAGLRAGFSTTAGSAGLRSGTPPEAEAPGGAPCCP